MPRLRRGTDLDPTSLADTIGRGRPFPRTDAVSAGLRTRHDLRTRGRRLFPGVHLDSPRTDPPGRDGRGGPELTPGAHDLVRGAVVWAPEGAVVAGHAAALLHGERYFAAEAVRSFVDLYMCSTPRVPPGIRNRRLRAPLPAGHVTEIDGTRCTTPARTAFDLGRWTPDDAAAIAHMDAICNRAKLEPSTVRQLALDQTGVHGRRRVLALLDFCDRGADSPQETRMRLILRRTELPSPRSQVAIAGRLGEHIATADLAFEAERVALFYDGRDHLAREQRDWDARVTSDLDALGWRSLRVTAGMLASPREFVRRVVDVLRLQGSDVEYPAMVVDGGAYLGWELAGLGITPTR